TGPLSDFQHTVVTDRHDVFSFVESLNARCDRPLAADILYTSFGRSWSDFKTAIESIKDDADGAEIPKRSVEDKIEEVLDRVRNIEATMASVPQLAVSPSMLQQAARDRLRSNRDRSKPLVDALVTYINKEGHGVVRAIPHDDGERVEIVFPDGISDEELGKIGTMVGEAFPSRYFTVWLTTENQDRVVQVFPNEMGV
ncbi:MAG: hypothetical protein JO246_14625, partial [Frankiaceae bacterium]|nr:hypothetical protein [Frankiaceae bacterium]